MIVNETETRNFSAVSAIGLQNNQATPVVYMNASYDSKNGLSFSENIREPELYKQHKDEADTDIATFKASVQAKVLE